MIWVRAVVFAGLGALTLFRSGSAYINMTAKTVVGTVESLGSEFGPKWSLKPSGGIGLGAGVSLAGGVGVAWR